jgi:hypothetical protein
MQWLDNVIHHRSGDVDIDLDFWRESAVVEEMAHHLFGRTRTARFHPRVQSKRARVPL